MSDNPVEPTRQETEADSPSQAAPRAAPKIPVLGIIILTTLLGCLVPYAIVKIQENSYQKLFSPPEKATEILTEDYGGLYIRTAEGKVFLCGVKRDGSALTPSLCTETALENVPEVSDLQSRCINLPTPPGKVIASYKDCAPLPDGSSSTSWVILEDGSVWRWHLTCAMFGCGANAISPMILGAVGGFLIGVIIVAALGFRRKSRGGQLTETNASAALSDESTTPQPLQPSTPTPQAQTPDALHDEDACECEACGTLVAANATVCPACGTQFED